MSRKLIGPTIVTALAALCSAGLSAQGRASEAFPVPEAVQVVRDLPYARYEDRELKLDLYLPSEATRVRPTPVILVVRGGGWRQGDKEGFAFIAGQMADAGFAAASIEYRTVQEAPLPAAVFDAKAAVRWLRANASTYGIDPSRIGAIGGSAGAHIVALLGTTGGLADLEGTGGNPTMSSAIQAVVAMACPCDMEALASGGRLQDLFGNLSGDALGQALRLSSPAAHVSAQSAPLLLLHSRSDGVVPYEQSEIIEDIYRRAALPVTLEEVEAQGHAFWNQTAHFPGAMRDAVQHFREHLGSAPQNAADR